MGIDKVGILDDFFALGGDSLLLIQFHTKLKEKFETDIAVVDLYKYNTVASLAGYLKNDNKEESQPVFEEVNSRVNKQLELMKQRRQRMQTRKGVEFGE
ncbi:acyl carrier protein [Ruminiclostridium cellobioparum]|uniref:acyl carrier protein n=1 Tax=Ruminiclostridium cellobioparum TaxID=29355 RepID=UPI0028ABCAA3|nr:phosphopantetheine-binding protein [Ruminiclostridium cellobioparum]